MEPHRSRFFHLLEIQSPDRRIVRQSRLLQILVALTAAAGLAGAIPTLMAIQQGQPTSINFGLLVGQLVGVLIFTFTTFYLLHRGHFLSAVHVFFITLNAIILTLLFSTGNDVVFPYLLLISVFSIAALQSTRVSMLYLAVCIAAVGLYHFLNSPDPIGGTSQFFRVAFFLVIPSWFFANDLRNSRDSAGRLTRELEATVANLDKRADQLEQIAEVGQVATASLDQEKLLRNSIELIQSRFGFYYVSVFLLNLDGSRLVLQEASGENGRMAAKKGNHLTVGQLSIAGWVAINRQARIALDVGEDPYFFDDPDLPDTHSEVALPLIARSRLLGVLDVHSREINAFQEEDIAVLQVMADQIAAGIDNARLFEEISQQATQLTELQTITNLMSQQANTRNALNVVAERAVALFDADGGGVFMYRPEKENLKLLVNLDVSDTRTGETLKPGEGLSGRAFAENKTLSIDDYLTWEGRAENFVQANFNAAVAIPLRRQNEPIGVLTLTRSRKGQPFKPDEIQIAELLAAQVSAIILNNELIEETRRLVKRERTINQAAAQIRRSLDAKTILDTTADELGQLWGNRVVKARLFPQQESHSEDTERL